jgi:transcriptional regulator
VVRVPKVDRPIDEAEWRGFVAAQWFGHLVAAGEGRADPVVVPTPYLLDGDMVWAHAAVNNELFDALAERGRATLAVAGDTAYVPSSWKAIGDEDPRMGIPTYYFAAVQLTGRCEVVDDPEELAALLARQLGVFQPDVDVVDPLEAHRARLGQIRGVALHVEEVSARFKFGGNVDEEHRLAVLDHLVERDGAGDRLAAARVRRRVSAASQSAFRRP